MQAIPLRIGLIRTSLKENERRVVVHPDHLGWLPEQVRKNLVLEVGYGVPFGFSDEELRGTGVELARRDEIYRRCDVVVNFKPVQADFEAVREGGVFWCCPHFVQQYGFTQAAIDRRLTVIAIESMHIWGERGDKVMHAFQKISELGGYAGVFDALRLRGIDGRYGRPRRAIVVGFGAVGRGAVYALQGLGFRDISVFTFRPPCAVENQLPGIAYRQVRGDGAGHLEVVDPDASSRPFIDEVVRADVIVNAILQDADAPRMIIASDQLARPLARGCVIIDAACDEGMGFPFARPTTFDNPMFAIGDAFYYGVDHTPSYLWESASWEISKCFVKYLPVVMGGPARWDEDETVRRAIEVRGGVVQLPKILSFQRRAREYPHAIAQSRSAADSG